MRLTWVSVHSHGLQLMLLSSSFFLVSPIVEHRFHPFLDFLVSPSWKICSSQLPAVYMYISFTVSVSMPSEIHNHSLSLYIYIHTIHSHNTHTEVILPECTLTDIVKKIYSLRQWLLRFKNPCHLWISRNISPLLSHPTSYGRSFLQKHAH